MRSNPTGSSQESAVAILRDGKNTHSHTDEREEDTYSWLVSIRIYQGKVGKKGLTHGANLTK